MKHLLKITFLLIIVLLPWEIQGGITSFNYIAETQPVEANQLESNPSDNQPLFYLINHQDTSGFILPERVPVVNSISNQQDKDNENFHLGSEKQRNSSSLILLCSRISLSLTVKEIIFPFHTFL
ncbi:MAG: hypothetical protein WD059_05755 [Balneolaceae bacterium]